MAIDRLTARIAQLQNPTVVGLDPDPSYLPQALVDAAVKEHGKTLKAAAEAVISFNKGIIDGICDIVPAIKPQSAYYEMYGPEGLRALAETVAYAKQKGLLVIMDGKRNDIGSTASAYARAYLGKTSFEGLELPAWDADALTVNAYLGSDGIVPFLKECNEHDKMIFVLVKTSNPSSGELQDKLCDKQSVYSLMGEMVERWGADAPGQNGYSKVGAVVGATYPEQLAQLRAAMPHTFFLVPGYGAQGAGAAEVKPAFDAKGGGAIINSSRGIICAHRKTGLPFAEAARSAALAMQRALGGLFAN